MTNTLDKLTRLALLCGIALLASVSTGCVVEVDGDPIIDSVFIYDRADMEVRWSINRSTDPTWCDDLGIETWLVEVSGPDARDVYVDCRADYWNTGSSLYGLDEGDYRVRLTALDFDDVAIMSAGARVNDVYDDGGVDLVDMRLDERDF